MAKDPVCGMVVDEGPAGATAIHRQQTCHVRTQWCKATFDKAPGLHAARRKESLVTRISTWIAAVAAGGLTTAAYAQERPWGWGWHPMWGMWGAWGIGMLLVMLTFWVVVIVALVAGIRWLIAQGREPRSDAALDILRQRYARGEINKDEFEAKKRDLS
jgi:putative membrane protein